MPADHSVRTSVPDPAPAPAPVKAGTPAKKPRLSIETLAGRLAWMDGGLIVLVLVAAFLLAAFPATNSDLLQQFAVGRLLVEGKYQFGVDPFTFTTEGVYWANHSWLFGLIAYGLYSIPAIGGAVLVVVKAMLVSLLALVMLRSGSRPGERWWVPATITGIAVVALSPQLALRPTVVSYLFLGLTVWFLIRPAPQKPAAREIADRKKKGRAQGVPIPFKAYWPLPVLCLLWVNIDQWFFLGPLTIGLYLAAVALQEKFRPVQRGADDPAEKPKTLGLVFLASVAACLVSPHYYHAFVVPPQLGLGAAADAVRESRQFQPMFLSPLTFEDKTHIGYLETESVFNIVAYCGLLLLGVISFALSFRTWRWWRLALWLSFAALSLYHARAIPFFAVVAAPITALNLLDFAAVRLGPAYLDGPNARSWAVSGRVLTLFLTLLLCVAAVPGWTQGKNRDLQSLHFGPRVEWEPSLRQAAEKIAAWRKDGKLPDNTRWFNTSPDVVNYFAWFCPGEKGFLDQRLALFDRTAGDYVSARKLLLKVSANPLGSQDSLRELRDLFDQHKIDFVAAYDTDIRSPTCVLKGLLSQPDDWPRVSGYGRTGLFWRKNGSAARASEAVRGSIVDDAGAAFGPAAVPAPRTRPGREPEPREWYQDLWRRRPPLFNADADDAQFHLRNFEAGAPARVHDSLRRRDLALAASLPSMTLPASPNLVQAAFMAQLFRPDIKPDQVPNATQKLAANLAGNYLTTVDHGPPESLYLALRAARRALHKNPDDATTYLLLARIYLWLQTETREGSLWPPELVEIRRAQVLGALNQAVRLNPDLLEAHEILANQYQQLGWADLRLQHLREVLRCAQEQREELERKAGTDLSAQIKAGEEQVQKLDEEVKRRLDRFDITVASKPPAELVRELVSRQQGTYGLGERTLKLLRELNYKELAEKDRPAAMLAGQMQIDLQFLIGQLDEIRATVKRGSDVDLGVSPQTGWPAVEWARIRLAAVAGDYDEADEELEKQIERVAASVDGRAVAGLLSAAIMGAVPRLTGALGPLPAAHDCSQLVGRLKQTPPAAQQELVSRFYRGVQQYPNQGLWFLAVDDAAMAVVAPMVREAELRVLRGWLALEAGDNRQAAAEFRRALTSRWPPKHATALALTLGSTAPLDATTSLFSSWLAVKPPVFEYFNGYDLAVRGLKWLEAHEKER
jgi:hypothetical protein